MTEEVILSNSLICNSCKDVIYSKNRHDFTSCGCGACFVDGGTDYLRHGGFCRDISIVWTKQKYDNLSALMAEPFRTCDLEKLCHIYIESEGLDMDSMPKYMKAAEWCAASYRNIFGFICAFARTERDGDFYE